MQNHFKKLLTASEARFALPSMQREQSPCPEEQQRQMPTGSRKGRFISLAFTKGSHHPSKRVATKAFPHSRGGARLVLHVFFLCSLISLLCHHQSDHGYCHHFSSLCHWPKISKITRDHLRLTSCPTVQDIKVYLGAENHLKQKEKA